jgi:hypothetical protein
LAVEFPGRDVKAFKVCVTCKDSIIKSKIPPFSSSSEFRTPKKPIYEKCTADTTATPYLHMRIDHVGFANLYA